MPADRDPKLRQRVELLRREVLAMAPITDLASPLWRVVELVDGVLDGHEPELEAPLSWHEEAGVMRRADASGMSPRELERRGGW